jgi:heptosyltransferase-3
MGKPRILVLRGGAIGDFVMTLPVLAALRRRWPESFVEILGYPHIASLALAGGLADSVRSLDRASAASLFVPEQPLPPEMALYVRSFDIIINFLYDPDDSVRTSLEKAEARQVLAVTPRMGEIPAARHLMKVLEPLAIFPDGEPYPRLELKGEALAPGRERMAPWNGRAVVFHPGSGGGVKNWPLPGFLQVAERVRSAGFEPVFSFGEADAETAQEFDKKGTTFPVLPRLDLPGLAGMLAQARGYVGNDSGVSHVAAAVGVPAVCLFGPSDPEIWASRAPHVRVVRSSLPTSESLAAVPVDAVWSAVAQMLALP